MYSINLSHYVPHICNGYVSPFFYSQSFGFENTPPLQDKQELLKQFVQHGENIESIETSLTLSREQVGSVQRNKELLTIAEMKSKGFSQQLGDLLNVRFLLFLWTL